MIQLNLRKRLLAYGLVALAMQASPLAAHEGHTHEAPAPAEQNIAPRFAVRGDALEVVGVGVGSDLLIYLDRLADNAPIENAKIEVEGPGAFKGVPTALGDGVYRLHAPALAAPGKHALTISVEAGALFDLLPAELTVDAAAAAHGGLLATPWRWLLFVLIAAMVVAAAWVMRKRIQRGHQ